MFPIFWRYLLVRYLCVFALALTGFIAVLMTLRLDDIVHFASLGASYKHLIPFVWHQIPYILPIAIPIACVISAMILIQRLSMRHELTAFRAAGFPLWLILSPILIAAAFLSLTSFYITSEMATQSHLATNTLKNELRSINPLLLLRNKHLMRLKGGYFTTLGSSRMDEAATDAVLALPNRHTGRINLMLAKELSSQSGLFSNQGVTLINAVKSRPEGQNDTLLIENIQAGTTTAEDFAELISRKGVTLSNDHLRLPLLLIKLNQDQENLARAKVKGVTPEEKKHLKRTLTKNYSEITRRFSLSFAAFSFTLMGAAFGITVGRAPSHRGVVIIILLAALYLAAYFSAKGVEHLFPIATALYLVPHAVILISAVWMLKRITKGKC